MNIKNNFKCHKSFKMSQILHRVAIYGGKGFLGSRCVQNFKKNNWWVSSIDFKENSEADNNIIVKENDTLIEQEKTVIKGFTDILGKEKLDAIICVAGGWKKGNTTLGFVHTADVMWQKIVWTSMISSSLAAKFLKEGGLLTLTGAKAALKETPKMVGYGMSKNAVHVLTKNLASEGSGMPPKSAAIAIVPDILDTPTNRKWMPEGDFSNWTPLDFVADALVKWSQGENRPQNGSLVQFITKANKTEIVPFDRSSIL